MSHDCLHFVTEHMADVGVVKNYLNCDRDVWGPSIENYSIGHHLHSSANIPETNKCITSAMGTLMKRMLLNLRSVYCKELP